MNAQYDYGRYFFTLAGGTLANTSGTNMGSGTSNHWYGSITNITLTANSSFDINGSMLLGGGGAGVALPSTINLDGNTLTVTIRKEDAQLYLDGVKVKDGALVVRRADGIAHAWLHLYNWTDASTSSFDIDTSVAMYGSCRVMNLVNRYEGLRTSSPGFFSVSGTFKPVGTSFPEVVMLDGSTIDLRDFDGVFSTRSTLSEIAPRYLGAAHGANVTIDITGRSGLRTGDRVIAWEAEPELLHRWSFNGTYEDSVGGATASAVGTVTLDSTTVSMPGTEAGRVALGSWLIPTNAGPVTVELWARQNTKRVNAKLFTCGNDSGSHGFCLMNTGDLANYQGWIGIKSGTTTYDTAWTLCRAEAGQMEHFSIMMDNVASLVGWTGMLMRQYALDGSYGGGMQPNHASWSLPALVQTATYIGGCGWNNTDADATFDEVRIWRGALTAADLQANAVTSCDTVNKSFRETAKFKFVQGDRRWSSKAMSDGLYLDRRGLMLIVR